MAEEKTFENKVKRFLKDNGAWVLKYWGGAAYTKAGIPDLLVCLNGYFIGIELKASKGRISDLQRYQLRLIEQAGGIGFVLYPEQFELFKNFVGYLKSGDIPAASYNIYDVYPFLTDWVLHKNQKKKEI